MTDISICMITYNHEAFIHQAIESILSQKTNYSFELVIGEDCGTDDTRKICEQYASKYPNKIKLLPSDRNYGVTPNFLRTYAACSSRYIAMCEGDDYWIDDNKLQMQADFMEKNPDYAICCGRSRYIGYNGQITSADGRADKNQTDFTAIDYLLKMSFETATIFFRKKTGFVFPDSFTKAFSSDQFLVLLLTMKGEKIKYIDKDIAMYRYHSGGITKKTNQRVIVDRLFSMLDDFDGISEKRYHKYVTLRKRFTLIGRNYFLLNYPQRLLFITKNVFFAIRFKQYIPFTIKTFARYILPLNKK